MVKIISISISQYVANNPGVKDPTTRSFRRRFMCCVSPMKCFTFWIYLFGIYLFGDRNFAQ